MSIVGATKEHGVGGRSKAYQVKDDYYRHNREERKATQKFIALMRACNGCPWTPELEDAVLKDDVNRVGALLNIPNLTKL